jgi:hypothetical protein
VGAVLAVVVASPAGAVVAFMPAIAVQQGATCAYDTPAYVHEAPALSLSQSTATLGVRGMPAGPGAVSWGRSVSILDRVVPANTAAAPPSTFVRTEALSVRGSARIVREIADSMRTNGWRGDPIRVVEQNGQRIVVDGHHRLAAAQRAGIEVPYEVVPPSSVIGPGRWSSIDDILRDAASVGPNRIR